MTDAELRTALRPHIGRYGSPIHRLATTGEIAEHTHRAILDRIAELESHDRDYEADQLHDAAEYVLDVGSRPAIEGWTNRN